MKKLFTQILLIKVFFIVPLLISAQEKQILSKHEKITINNDSSFTRELIIRLEYSKDRIVFPIFYDTELEEVTEVKVYIKKGNRYKKLRKPFIKDESVDINHISSKKRKSILLPPETEARITYKVNCSELLYFSSLNFFSYDNIDTLRYQINVPESFHFAHSIVYEDSLRYLQIDSSKTENTTQWDIEVVPVKVEPSLLMFFGFYKKLKVPFMRTIVVPSAYKNKEKEYMNDWFLDEVKSKRILESTTIQKIDEITYGITDPFEIMDTLYNYVRENFKYVAIEIGMGAFIPSTVNEVFLNKQGDCKDLSNFLCTALDHKGIKSHLALAATFNHISDCDFPSLGSANHVVCVAYINNNPVVLDPTDPVHIPDTPVESLQQRTILIVNPEGGEYYKIKSLSPRQNEINYEIELKTDTEKGLLRGAFYAEYSGISANFLKRKFLDASDNDIMEYGKKFYERVFGNNYVSDVNVRKKSNSIITGGNLSLSGKVYTDNEVQYIFIDFLPELFETENRKSFLEGIYIGNTIYKKVNLRIITDEPFRTFSPVEHSFTENGVSLNLKISNPSDLNIDCTYEFLFDYISIDKENMEITNEILQKFIEVINEPLILNIER